MNDVTILRLLALLRAYQQSHGNRSFLITDKGPVATLAPCHCGLCLEVEGLIAPDPPEDTPT
jgi:hypothetical protein